MDELLAELTQPLFHYLLRMTRDRELAADLTQEALLRAWKNRLALRENHARRVWVFRIGTHLFHDHLRKKHCYQAGNLEWLNETSPVPSPASQAMQREGVDRITNAMNQLPPRQRQVMYLRAVEQLNPREIAQVLELDAGVVRSNLAAARKRLQSELSEFAGDVDTHPLPGGTPEMSREQPQKLTQEKFCE